MTRLRPARKTSERPHSLPAMGTRFDLVLRFQRTGGGTRARGLRFYAFATRCRTCGERGRAC